MCVAPKKKAVDLVKPTAKIKKTMKKNPSWLASFE
jgi:hypothetical protein